MHGNTTTIETPTRTILVTRLEVEKTGEKNGKPWTLYKVYATELDGTPIQDELRTFDSLEAGEVTVKADAFVKDGQIQHYTLKAQGGRKRTRRAGGGSDTEALEARIEKLEKQMRAIVGNRDLELEF